MNKAHKKRTRVLGLVMAQIFGQATEVVSGNPENPDSARLSGRPTPLPTESEKTPS